LSSTLDASPAATARSSVEWFERATPRARALPAGAAITVGWATALLTYSVMQLAHAGGWEIIRVEPDDIPLFIRWRAALILGSIGAIGCWALPAPVLSPKFAAYAVFVACLALLIVVAFAP
jgi:hypothetical protein